MVRKALACLAFTVCLLLVFSINAQDKRWKQSLKSKFDEAYVMTKVQGNLFGISKPGTVLVVQKEGIRADIASDENVTPTIVQDGQIKAEGAGGEILREIAGIFSNGKSRKEASLYYGLGERVYIQGYGIYDNEINFLVISCDVKTVMVQGSTINTRFKSLVSFKFPKNYLSGADFSDIKATIESVLADEKGIRTAAPKSVELGQTPQQVEEILGKPENIVRLGNKLIYVYRNLKITFMNGKVADVQ